jgi:hypothetical protein
LNHIKAQRIVRKLDNPLRFLFLNYTFVVFVNENLIKPRTKKNILIAQRTPDKPRCKDISSDAIG